MCINAFSPHLDPWSGSSVPRADVHVAFPDSLVIVATYREIQRLQKKEPREDDGEKRRCVGSEPAELLQTQRNSSDLPMTNCHGSASH